MSYYEEHKEEMNKYTREYYRNNPQYRLFVSTLLSAKKKGLEHTITKEDIIIPQRCPYLQTPITNHPRGHPDIRNNPSVDRIDPSLGYVKGNIRVLSWKANAMKQNANWDELVAFAKAILQEDSFYNRCIT